jgi:hypothetical protein
MPRGKTQRTKDLIAACYTILEEIQPATVRAVCYQLFIRKLLASMAVLCTKRVSSHLVYAREAGLVPWAWIVDETREAERQLTGWEDPEAFMHSMLWMYRRDRWTMQPRTVEVWSEKATVAGTLRPVLRQYGVTFRRMGGFNSATKVHEVAEASQKSRKPFYALYIGDWDPSGLYMSLEDLPRRLERYGAALTLRRLALVEEDIHAGGLPGFPASDKQTDTRYKWFRHTIGTDCWELDALSPPLLRARVEAAIVDLMDMHAWHRADAVEKAERASMQTFFGTWTSITGQVPE